jgi:pyruvate dehydrogenase E2 component (dihydrolipoamide acetyltransferase)
MAFEVIMPRQGQSVESCILTEVRVKKGDTVSVGDVLFAYETDKASFEEEAKAAGSVLEIFFEEGDEVPVLTRVMIIGEAGTATADRGATAKTPEVPKAKTSTAATDSGAMAKTPEAPKSQTSTAPQATTMDRTSTVSGANISPRAKALAKKHDVEIGLVAGSGPSGRVIERDVRKALDSSPRITPLARAMMREGLCAPESGSGLGAAIRGCDLGAAGTKLANAPAADSTIVPLTNMRRLIARAMHASLQNSAQLTHHLGADARRMMELRGRAKESGRDITINDLVCWAVVRALEKFPTVNAHFLGEKEGVRRFSGVHLAVAVDTERGLMVPVVRDAHSLTIDDLAHRLRDVATACRKGSINPDLLSSEAAGFTVSNLGNYGVEVFTPIINLPQVAILGVNTIVPRPKDLGGGVFGFVPFIGLSLTYDHRALDGGEATRFLKQIAIEIETLDIKI